MVVGPDAEATRRGIGFTLLARGLSIFGHPLLVLPAAGLVAWTVDGGSGGQAAAIAMASLGAAALVLGYSNWRVRTGAWAHVDASERGERRHLNRFLLLGFVAAALAGLICHWPPAVSLSLLLSAAMVAVAMLGSRWCKPSLHVAFAVLAAALLFVVSVWAVAAGLLLALAIAWSRLHLGRHVGADLWSGALIGGTAGAAFWIGLRALQS